MKILLFIFAGLNISILVNWLRQWWYGSTRVNQPQVLSFSGMTSVKLSQQSDFQALVENAPDAIMRLDRNFRYLYVNRKLEQEAGLSRTQMLGKTSTELGFPDALVALWHQVIEQVIHTAEEQQIEYEAPSSQGLAHYSSRVVPEYSATGTIESVMAIVRNITDEKQAEKLIQQQFQQSKILWEIARSIRQSLQLEEILNTAVTEIRTFLKVDRVIIYQFDSTYSGTVVVESVEPGFVSMLHQAILDPCLDILGLIQRYTQGYAFIVEDIYTANLTPCHQQLLSQYEIRANLVVPILLQNDRLWGLLAAQQCSDARKWQRSEVDVLQQLSTQVGIAIQQGELYQQLQSLNTDLEQQVQTRTQELQKALEFESSLKRITDQVRDSLDEDEILRVAVKELALGLNVKCCDAAIYNAEQTVSTIIHEYNQSLPALIGQQFVVAEFYEPAIYQTLLRGECSQFCFTVIQEMRPTSERLAILACPIRDDQRVLGDLWLFRPSEEGFQDQEIRLVQQVANQCAIALRQARLYQAAQCQVTELERINQLKDDFLSTVSHELRSPMSNIYMASQMLEIFLKPYGVFEDAESGAGRYFTILQTECRREIGLVNNLLDLSRMESGVDPLVLTRIDLAPWIMHLVEPFESRMQKQQQYLVVDVPAALPPLTTDLDCLEKAVTELIHNACKYTPAGEMIAIVVEITPVALLLKIRNSGVQIPAAELPRIFDKFHRVPSNDPWKQGGTGLGLALVKKRVEQIQGSISVTSGHDWTCFTVQLPWLLNQDLTHEDTVHPYCFAPVA
jgi:PAS domain S-box-containing protein